MAPREKYLFWDKINFIFKELVNYVESENKSKSKMKMTAVLNYTSSTRLTIKVVGIFAAEVQRHA